MTEPAFSKYAGTLVADGEKQYNPVFNLEEGSTDDITDLPAAIDGLAAKLSGIIINPTMVYNDNLADLFVKSSAEFGVGYEETGYVGGAPDYKSDGTCKQIGNVSLADPMYHSINYAVHEVLEIKDDEFKRSVFNADQLASLVANKIETIAKTRAQKLRLAYRQIVSDVIDGARSIASNTKSDGTGDAVTYAPTVTGYAGKIYDGATDFGMEKAVSGVTIGYQPAFTAADALAFLKGVKTIGRDIAIESTDFNLSGREVFVEGKPILTLEKKVLDALNYALMDGDQHKLGYNATGASDFLADTFEVKPIDAFAALPTNEDYTNVRLGAVISVPGVFREVTYKDSMETARCTGRRSNIYDYQALKAMWASTMLPSAAVLFPTTDPEMVTATFIDSADYDYAVIGKVTVKAGDVVNFETVPEHDGEVFDAWDPSFTSGTTTIAADTTFIATYE